MKEKGVVDWMDSQCAYSKVTLYFLLPSLNFRFVSVLLLLFSIFLLLLFTFLTFIYFSCVCLLLSPLFTFFFYPLNAGKREGERENMRMYTYQFPQRSTQPTSISVSLMHEYLGEGKVGTTHQIDTYVRR